jgi:hypothetical protein
MSPEMILIGLMALPVVLLFLLSVNAALVFLSLCLGNVLVQFVSDDAISIVSGAGSGVHATESVIKLALLLAPALLVTLFMIKTVHGKYKKFLNLLPAIGVGLLTVLLVVPITSPGLQDKLMSSNLWQSIQQFESGIVAVSTLLCLFFLLLQRPKKHEEKHGKHHK